MSPKKITKDVGPKLPILYAFVNSTMAMFLAASGFFVQDLLIARAIVGFNLMVCLVAIVFNLVLIYLWPRIGMFRLAERSIFLLLAAQWSWIGLTVGGLYFGSQSFALVLILLIVCFAVRRVAFGASNKWLSTTVFSVFGVVTMGSTIWQGLGDWSISATAKSINTPNSSRPMIKDAASKTIFRGKENPSDVDMRSRKWGYQGETGPAMWGQLRDEYRVCSDGLNQSPVDIQKHAALSRDWIKTGFAAESGQIDLSDSDLTPSLSLSGRSQIRVGRDSYAAKQVLLHSPSEHQLSGLSFPMEMQFFFQSKTGQMLGIAVFVEIGSANKEFEKILSQLKQPAALKGTMFHGLRLSELIPAELSAYRYNGSLTTPPCTEGVKWSVVKRPIEVSGVQLAEFRKIISSNVRPIQPIGSRKFEGSVDSALSH